MDLNTIAALGAALMSAISIYKNVRDKRFDDIDKRLEELRAETKDGFKEVKQEFKEVRQEIKEIKTEISSLKERVASIEMSTVFLQINPNFSPRSDVAEKIIQIRKNQELASKE